MSNSDSIRLFFKKNKAISATAVADEAGINPSAFRNYLAGDRNLPEKHLPALLTVLKKYGFKEDEGTCKVITVLNHKGGVGKTTTTMNLGKALALLGKKVLLIDIDPQANLTQHCGVAQQVDKTIVDTLLNDEVMPVIDIEANFHLVPSELALATAESQLMTDVNGWFKLKNALKFVKSPYDYILVDCPPSLGILTNNALLASDEVVVVVETEYLAISGLGTITKHIDGIRRNSLNENINLLGLLFTKTNNTVVSKEIVKELSTLYKSKVFKTSIRRNISLVEAAGNGTDIFSYAEDSHGAEDYMKFAKEVVEK
ncbi:ParA family protein [Flexithrix dorotheae]|uniref:ParA family protein n=1 Tax=Flexithrix dorotheae TaxID=70993 RepID=UPI0003768F8C|nr:ParA family protein [Flexithrix dorotheae]